MKNQSQENNGGHAEMTELQLEQLQIGIIDLVGVVDEEMMLYLRHATSWLQVNGNPTITVQISSGGGDAHCGLAIYDILRLYKGDKTGLVIEQASSAAAIILQSCTKRVAAKHATLLIHLVASTHVSMDQLYGKKLKEFKKHMLETQRSMEEIISARTGKKLRQVRATCQKDKSMNSTEALEFGLIDEIA